MDTVDINNRALGCCDIQVGQYAVFHNWMFQGFGDTPSAAIDNALAQMLDGYGAEFAGSLGDLYVALVVLEEAPEYD